MGSEMCIRDRYDKEWNQEEVKEMSGLDKTLASLSGFYYTDAEETPSYQKADLPEQTDLSLLDYADTATVRWRKDQKALP